MRRVLVLRPEPGASETVRRAKEQGLDALAVPLFEIEPVEWEAPDAGSFDALLLTSANAVRHAGDGLQQLRGLPVYAVGDATAEAAREAGFDIKGSGDAGVDRLLGSIEPDMKLLHLCGEDRRETEGARQKITPVVVYRSKAVSSPDLAQAPGCVALIHSPRAAARLSELVADKSEVAIAAISAAAADQAGDGWRLIEVAEHPRDDALLALAARLCNTLQGI
jgi:uroporphyrinogen-III synthase